MYNYATKITVNSGSTYLNYKGIHVCTMIFFNRAIAISIVTSIFSSTETLEGQSAFRLKNPFSEQGDQKLQKRYYAPPDNGLLDVRDLSPKPSHREAETNKDQWYSTEEGMQLFGKIHGALQEHFEVRPSRDTTSHDLCLFLKSTGQEFAVNFPYNFPHDSAILIRGDNRKEAIRLTEASSEGGNTEGSKDKKAPNSAKDEENAQDTDEEGNLDPAKISQSPPTSAQDEEKDKGAEASGSLDPEEIPQLLYQGIYRLVFGTHV